MTDEPRLADVRAFALLHAAEMVLIEYEYAVGDRGGWSSDRVAATYEMAVEMMACILHLDAEPAKAQIDRMIWQMLQNPWNRRLAIPGPPNPDDALSFDEVEAAGLDGTNRNMVNR